MSSNEQGFYITLPSESSKKLFPDNNPSEYTVRLPRWVHLNGHWEIGLHSIAYTPWNIIHHLDEPISFMTGGKEGKGGKMRKHYSSVNEYVSGIRESLKQAHLDKSLVDKSNEIEFFYLLNGKVKVHLSPGYTLRLRREQAIVVLPINDQGFAKRSQFIQNGKQFVLSGPIFTDIFMSDRLLLNMMDLKVVLNRSNPKFCLMDKTSEKTPTVNPQVKLSEVILKIRKVKVDQAVSDGIERMLKQTPALYPIRRVECKILTVPSGLPTTRQDNIFSGIIPKTFVVGFVNVDAANGTYWTNPYNFAHFGVTSLSLTANGEEIPFKQLTLAYPKKENGEIDPAVDKDDQLDFDEAYNTLFSGTGKIYSNAGLDIDRDEYPGGFALYAFDLTPDMCKSSEYFNTVQRGSLSLALTFREAAKHPLAMVCYGDFENVIRIDAERNAIYDIA